MYLIKNIFAVFFCALSYLNVMAQPVVTIENNSVIITSANKQYHFVPTFTVLYNQLNPNMALKPAGIKKVSYNVLTWRTNDSLSAEFRQKKVNASVAGDGFDDEILHGIEELRTANVYNSGVGTTITASNLYQQGDTVFFQFPVSERFELSAWLVTTIKPYPELHYFLKPLVNGYFSVGYTGAPAFVKNKVAESWQPLIWTEKRTPDIPYLTPAFMATLPATMLNDGVNTIGILASPRYLPFQPLPILDNSRFGVTLLNDKSMLQPQIFAPILGGYLSKMDKGDVFDFSFQLVVESLSLSYTYETVAEKVYGFKNYRHNDIASLNTALDNISEYSLTHYAWFIDSLKGCAYSTDVPGAVKNVSCLNPLELAIVRNDSVMFEKRAYPLLEFMLSRAKFLFSLDSTQKIQSPSRKLKGPIAPVSELGTLYNVFGKENDFYLALAKKEFQGTRVRNLNSNEKGNNWINAMFLYKATADNNYLQTSIKLAKKYLQQRVYVPQVSFSDPLNSSYFFWPTFTDKWIEFLELYELTKDSAFLNAAHEGARHYTMFTWMSPLIPDSNVTVNKGGKAPLYWYLKSKGHKQMYYPEEQAPAWRLSEIGLTPESSGTATGHRAIFMANYAPWMLRVGYYTSDTYLINVAKAAIIGRYRSFPGYHINTERTTAYEKMDFPLHEHIDQSVTSFHYNHILPMASMLLDYLVTDAFVRSKGNICFPNEYIEGYAYLQNKLYGASKGTFYTEKEVQLWMPARLLTINNVELNYIAARKNNMLLLSFANQSSKEVKTKVTINPLQAVISTGATVSSYTLPVQNTTLKDSSFYVTVPANGITSIAISNVQMKTSFQQKILTATTDKGNDYAKLDEGKTNAMLFKLGNYARRLYVYLEEDDTIWKWVKLIYREAGNKESSITKLEYPFEFTIPVDLKKPVQFSLLLTGVNGKEIKTKTVELGR
jgi:hypothetical protein